MNLADREASSRRDAASAPGDAVRPDLAGPRSVAPAVDLSTAAELPAERVLASLGSDAAVGLTSAEAATRLAEHGPNELEPAERTSFWRLLWDGMREPFIVLLFIAGCLAVALGETRDGLLVLVILAPIVGAGVVTEYRGERALEALRAAAAPTPHLE